jgi:hypothetical protein
LIGLTTDVLDYLADPAVFELEEGSVDVPDGPELGIDIDEHGSNCHPMMLYHCANSFMIWKRLTNSRVNRNGRLDAL